MSSCYMNSEGVRKRERKDGGSVFVTVGSTSFDDLVRAVTEEGFRKVLLSLGYEKLTVQIGRGVYTPHGKGVVHIDDSQVGVVSDDKVGVPVEWYRYKSSLTDDMTGASLIISHGGAGSILESLSLRKPLVVVINDELMNNHQTELARQLHKGGHLLYTTPSKLGNTVETVPTAEFVTFEPGDPTTFGHFLDSVMGFKKKH